MLMIMAGLAEKKREDEQVAPVTPQVATTQTDMLARLREARISRAEPKSTESMQLMMVQRFCTDFVAACGDKAKKEGTFSATLKGSEMERLFG